MFRPALCLCLLFTLTACGGGSHGKRPAEQAVNLLASPPTNPDGSVNVVVEIPAGTIDKWQVRKSDGQLEWEKKDGVPRVVQYLGYPGNYGMVPNTLLPREAGGDGDPLDVLVLGPAVPRGTIQRTRLVGVLKLLDEGEQDDKLLAVPLEGPFADVRDLSQLQARFPGVKHIIETWFASYEGPGVTEPRGYGSPEEARTILEKAIQAAPKRAP